MTVTPAHNDARSSIVLIGLRGCGKSTVGRKLAELLCGDCVDTDELIIERAGKSIAELFAAESEAGFRRREHDVIAEVARERPAVISVGGGAVMDARNIELLRAAGRAVWLTAPVEVLWRRIKEDTGTLASRPALTDLSGPKEVGQLLAERTPYYEAAAEFAIDTATRGPAEVAGEIIRRLGLTEK